MNRSPITWCDFTWNPITGCQGPRGVPCDYCYARKVAQRFGSHIEPEPTTTACVSFSVKQPFPFDFFPTIYPHRLDEPLRRKKPATIFMCSMGDLFDPAFPDDFRRRVFVTCAVGNRHTFLLLTKQPAEMQRFIAENSWAWNKKAIPNLWLGVTVTNQADADERIPLLLATPAAHRFVSVEPMLGPVDLQQHYWTATYADWLDLVIAGGKTPGQPLHEVHPDWLRFLRDQRLAAKLWLHYKHGGTNPELDGVVYDWRPQ